LNPLTKDLPVTHSYGGGALIGVPLLSKNGEKFGTLCGLDNKSFHFTEEHVQLFISLACLLSYTIQLDHSYHEIRTLSVPLVPIAKGVAILPLIGELTNERAEIVMEKSLVESRQLSLDYLVIDLSGVSRLDETVTYHLLKIVSALKLVGVKAILTGIRPELAIKAVKVTSEFSSFQTYPTLASALSHIKS
jgi:rsbT co-antagonist protein RsbR